MPVVRVEVMLRCGHAAHFFIDEAATIYDAETQMFAAKCLRTGKNYFIPREGVEYIWTTPAKEDEYHADQK